MKLLWFSLVLLVPLASFGQAVELPAAGLSAAQSRPGITAGITAVGDVHGDLETFRNLLNSAELIDENDHWRGGARHLVQTGDVVDRGAGSRQVLELLMRLESEAKQAGGQVVALLGNHEVMNLTGDLRYVLKEELAAYAGEDEPKLRQEARRDVLRLLGQRSPLLASDFYRRLCLQITDRTFDKVFPLGFFSHLKAFAPAGRYGRWLLQRPVVHREGRVIFLHGGLSPRYGLLPVESINKSAREDLGRYFEAVAELEKLGVFHRALGPYVLGDLIDEERRAGGPHAALERPFAAVESVLGGILFAEDGPLWYRGLAYEPEERLAGAVAAILKAQDADRMVIGHSQPASLTVEARFANRVILIDTGMNQAAYQGLPSALLISPEGTLDVLEVGAGGARQE